MYFILGGDFSALLSMSEKKGSICPPIKAIEHFSWFVEDNNLSDIFPTMGHTHGLIDILVIKKLPRDWIGSYFHNRGSY